MEQSQQSERAAATRAQYGTLWAAVLAEKEKKSPHNRREPDQHPKHPSFAGHKRALGGQARLQYRGVLATAVLARGPTQFRNVKNGIKVKSGTSFATFAGTRGRHIMPIDRNVMFGLIALIAIGFVALIVGGLLH
ncbi:MAG: hypothetical protein WAK90_09705 [Pseudolabrys sp.]